MVNLVTLSSQRYLVGVGMKTVYGISLPPPYFLFSHVVVTRSPDRGDFDGAI